MELHAIVDFETARDADGVRVVSSAIVPSPWSEGAKGVFLLAGVPALWLRQPRKNEAYDAWSRAHNVPVVMHDDEPPRTGWAEIVSLAARLARTPVVPSDVAGRVRTFGLLNELAGEDGLAWSARILMMHASFETDGQRGFSVPVSRYLATKYGYASERADAARARIRELLATFERELAASSTGYLSGDRPGALDAYLATCLAPIVGVSLEDCPMMRPELGAAFRTIAEHETIPVPASLVAHRRRMYEQHLPFPIAL